MRLPLFDWSGKHAQEKEWSKTFITPRGPGRTEALCGKRPGWCDAATAVHTNEAVVTIPNVVSDAEIKQLLGVSLGIAESERAECVDGAVRLHVPTRLPSAEIALCDTILRRLLRFIDAEFPELVQYRAYTGFQPAPLTSHAPCVTCLASSDR